LLDFARRLITERYRDRDQGDATRLDAKWHTAIFILSYLEAYCFRNRFQYIAGQFDLYL